MAALILNSCGSIPIPEDVQNTQWCHPFKNAQGMDIGASCDNLLTSNPQLLDAAGWTQLQAVWLANGGIPECTASTSMTGLKVFIENVCSQYPCDYATEQKIISSLKKIEKLGKQEN